MKLTYQLFEVEQLIAEKHNLPVDQVQIDPASLPPSHSETPALVLNAANKEALMQIFDEARAIGKSAAKENNPWVDKIRLIKAIRVIFPSASIKEAKDFVEQILLPF